MIFSVLSKSMSEVGKTFGYFMQDGATAHIANYSINFLSEAFEESLVCC